MRKCALNACRQASSSRADTSVVFGGNLVGKVASGFAYDGPHGRSFALGAIGLMGCGLALLVHLSLVAERHAISTTETCLFAVTYGLGYGGE